jgi:hypothetical protein
MELLSYCSVVGHGFESGGKRANICTEFNLSNTKSILTSCSISHHLRHQEKFCVILCVQLLSVQCKKNLATPKRAAVSRQPFI